MATDLAEFVGAAVGLNLLFGVPLLPGRPDHRGRRVRDPGPGAARLPPLRAGDRRPARHRAARLRLRPGGGRGRARRGIAAGLVPPSSAATAAAAGRRDHRRHGDAARGLPALGADQVPGGLPRRRRAARAAALPAARRARRARRRRPDQPGHAVRRRLAVPPHRRTSTSDSIEAAHAGLGRLVGGGAALAFAVALLASGLSSSSVGTYAGQVVMQGFIRRRIPLFLRRGLTMLPGAGGARRSACRPPTAW